MFTRDKVHLSGQLGEQTVQQFKNKKKQHTIHNTKRIRESGEMICAHNPVDISKLFLDIMDIVSSGPMRKRTFQIVMGTDILHCRGTEVVLQEWEGIQPTMLQKLLSPVSKSESEYFY